MKKITKLLPLLAVLMGASVAQAAETTIELKDNSPILGKWEIYAEAAAMHKEKKKVNIEWDFRKNGVLHATAKDARARTGTTAIKISYSIKEGAIEKQTAPGRSKYETCRVTKLEGSEMILHCKYLYFFMKKK
ncbi:MAG: hypothetical protein GQ569_12915 [Methylococcaceae bacterium]|nr:hypothetical protein [Methylococcaceae bacterium]